jgi:RNA polymerase sigma factor for flagellar operon FliA
MPKTTIEMAERDKLVLAHLGLAKAVANGIGEALPAHVDPEDLIAAGILGLFKAADAFEPQRGVKFSSYARFRIRGEILDALRELDWASRDNRRTYKRVDLARQELRQEHQREPELGELAERVGMTSEKLGMRLAEYGAPISFSVIRPDIHDLPGVDFRSRQPEPDVISEHEELGRIIRSAIEGLPMRIQRLMEMYYTDEMTMKQIAVELGCKESRISQLHKWGIQKLRDGLEANGLKSSAAVI